MQQLLRCGIFGDWTLKTRSMTTRTPQPLFDARKITIMAAAGTLLPLFCLALAFAFTPLPVTPRAAEVLRQMTAMAAAFIGFNALIVAGVSAANALVVRKQPPAGQTLRTASR